MDLKNKEEIIKTLFEVKAHLGHKKNRVHPRAKKYIYTFQNNTSIIDLEKTFNQILIVKKELEKIKKNKQTLILVGTKN
ncbi:MAG: 30S ribosomal protein S2, partial [Bacteroidales bacterium]